MPVAGAIDTAPTRRARSCPAHWSSGSRAGWVYCFKTAQQAAAFKAWSEFCGIDWSVPASEQPQETRPPKPPQGPAHGAVALNRIKPP
jgi:hypothetical protein